MNTNFEVAGHHIVIDMGTLELMAKAAGTGWANPIEGITTSKDQAGLILYGGLARVCELEEKPEKVTYDEAKKMIKTFAPFVITQLMRHYVAVLTIPGEEEIAEPSEEKKS